MADEKPKLTQDLKLGPGLTVTPDHEVHEPPAYRGPVFSDRVVDAHGNPAQHPTLSTYGQEQPAAVPAAAQTEPETSPAQTEPPAG